MTFEDACQEYYMYEIFPKETVKRIEESLKHCGFNEDLDITLEGKVAFRYSKGRFYRVVDKELISLAYDSHHARYFYKHKEEIKRQLAEQLLAEIKKDNK